MHMLPSQKQVERIRSTYPPGTRIRLISMDDPRPIPEGTKGTVQYVDDAGQLHTAWDNGRTFAIVPSVDWFEKVS